MIIKKEILEEWNLPAIVMPNFLSFLGNDFGYFVSEKYVLPYYIKKKLGCKTMHFILAPVPLTNIYNPEDERNFLNEINKYIEANNYVDFTSCPNSSALFMAVPDNSIYCKFGSYIIDLTNTEETLFSNLHSKHRNVIKKAQKIGISISNEKRYSHECFKLVNETLVRANMKPISDTYYNLLDQSSNVDFFVALENNKVIGSAILAWTKGRSSYYLYGGSSSDIHSGAMNLLHWEAIKLMKKRGVKWYDFVGARINPSPGSKVEGIQRFKSRFGGELKEGFLWKKNYNKIKSSFYSFALYSYGKIKKIQVKDIIDQENGKL